MQNVKGAKMEITISTLAAELGCEPSSISRYVKRGMPVLGDGSLDREQALNFIARQTSGSGGGWSAQSRHGKPSLQERAAKLLGIKSEFDFSEFDFSEFDFSGLPDFSDLLKSDSQAGNPKMESGSELQRKFFYDYGFASGMAHLARSLRDDMRVKLLVDMIVESYGVTAAQALKAARLFVYVANHWIVGLLKEMLGKESAKDFEQGLEAWLKSWKKADKTAKASKR